MKIWPAASSIATTYPLSGQFPLSPSAARSKIMIPQDTGFLNPLAVDILLGVFEIQAIVSGYSEILRDREL
jgi:hypothetical protein